MRLWLRRVMPPGSAVFGAFLGYLMCTLVPLGVFAMNGGVIEFPLNAPLGLLVLCNGAAAYGVFRVAGFHPVFRSEYYKWLRQTPWRAGLPLPVGPIHLVWQDVVYVAPAALLCLAHRHGNLLFVPTSFLVAYLLTLIVALSLTGRRIHAFVLVFALGFLCLAWGQPTAVVGCLAGLYLVVLHGLAGSMKAFGEWNGEWIESQVTSLSISGSQEAQRRKLLGWPFDRMAPKKNMWGCPVGWSAALGVLAGWWALVFMLVSGQGGQQMMQAFAGLMGMMLAFGRAAAYAWGYAPPINLWGRLFTFRFVLPRYDVVFAAPALILALNGFAIHLIANWQCGRSSSCRFS